MSGALSSRHVRRGDLVVVMKGKDRGKRGKVLRVKGDRVIVEKVAMIKRHTKPTQKNPQGGIVEKEGTIAIANVLLWDEKLGRGTRVRNVVEDGVKVRVGVKTGTKFPNPGM
jgi:large subunit ribosomal protein L24